MSHDMPEAMNAPYGGVPEDCIEECNELCMHRTISEIRAIGSFFLDKAQQLSNIAENDLTMEDFEKAKKQDLDGDGKAGDTSEEEESD